MSHLTFGFFVYNYWHYSSYVNGSFKGTLLSIPSNHMLPIWNSQALGKWAWFMLHWWVRLFLRSLASTHKAILEFDSQSSCPIWHSWHTCEVFIQPSTLFPNCLDRFRHTKCGSDTNCHSHTFSTVWHYDLNTLKTFLKGNILLKKYSHLPDDVALSDLRLKTFLKGNILLRIVASAVQFILNTR